MSPRSFSRLSLPSFSLSLLLALLVVLSIAGGASRADVWGQAVVRAAAAAALVLALLFAPRLSIRPLTPTLYLLLGALTLALLQLVPLAPSVWQALPGRALFLQAVDGTQPWRPLSIHPSGTLNAAFSLLIPFAVLILVSGIRRAERAWILPALLGLTIFCALIGVMQLSGAAIDNPYVNDTPGAVSGFFANRNHFALALALGCVMTAVWALQGEGTWRVALALGLNILFLLLILASGSRSGMALGIAGAAVGVWFMRRRLLRSVRRMPRWGQLGVLAACVGVVVALIVISLAAGRALSIDRVLTVDFASDMRSRAAPTITALAQVHYLLGTGFGSFDALFRINEPFDLLKPTYFNHAHNDFVEILLDGGLPALFLLATGLAWWLTASIRIWRLPASPDVTLGRLGSVMLLFIFLASIVDYPARVPMFMAIIVLASAWLSWASLPEPRSALRSEHQYL